MKTRLVRIGNSKGVRLPKPLIEQAGLTEEAELQVRGNTIIIAAQKSHRSGWAEAAQRLRTEDVDPTLVLQHEVDDVALAVWAERQRPHGTVWLVPVVGRAVPRSHLQHSASLGERNEGSRRESLDL